MTNEWKSPTRQRDETIDVLLHVLRDVGRAKSLHEAKSVALRALEEHGPVPPGYGEEITSWPESVDEPF